MKGENIIDSETRVINCIYAALAKNDGKEGGGGVIKQDQTPFQFHTQLYYTCISITHINYTDKALHHVNKYSRSSIQMIIKYNSHVYM